MHRVYDWVGRKDRHPVEIDAVILRDNGRQISAKLSNCSNEGCRIESEADFRIGEQLAIAIPRMGQMKAQVRWALEGSAGAKFVAEGDF